MAMNDDLITDLKQFIAATVSQATSDLATKEELKSLATKEELKSLATKEDLHKLEQKIDDIDLKIDTIADTLNGQLNDHDTRITKLEQQTA
jgi:hypothetical protein